MPNVRVGAVKLTAKRIAVQAVRCAGTAHLTPVKIAAVVHKDFLVAVAVKLVKDNCNAKL